MGKEREATSMASMAPDLGEPMLTKEEKRKGEEESEMECSSS
jgi:hypothetical protein